MVTLIALILIGTVIVLTTVVQYFGVDSRDVITELEMNMYERLASQARSQTVINGGKEPGLEKEQKIVATAPDAEFESGEGLPSVSYEEDKEQSLNEFMNGLEERGWLDSNDGENLPVAKNSTVDRKPRIPKIIHATWKTDVLPDRWEKIRQGCIDLHPD
jgi:mannosyltransferase OCH1-like enzyme